jgi:hypothetical protein
MNLRNGIIIIMIKSKQTVFSDAAFSECYHVHSANDADVIVGEAADAAVSPQSANATACISKALVCML